jgi:hypothetical protein
MAIITCDQQQQQGQQVCTDGRLPLTTAED